MATIHSLVQSLLHTKGGKISWRESANGYLIEFKGSILFVYHNPSELLFSNRLQIHLRLSENNEQRTFSDLILLLIKILTFAKESGFSGVCCDGTLDQSIIDALKSLKFREVNDPFFEEFREETFPNSDNIEKVTIWVVDFYSQYSMHYIRKET